MTLGATRQPCANRDAVTLGVYAWRPLKGLPTAKRGTVTFSGYPPTVRQPLLANARMPETRRALSCAPALSQAGPRGHAGQTADASATWGLTCDLSLVSRSSQRRDGAGGVGTVASVHGAALDRIGEGEVRNA